MATGSAGYPCELVFFRWVCMSKKKKFFFFFFQGGQKKKKKFGEKGGGLLVKGLRFFYLVIRDPTGGHV